MAQKAAKQAAQRNAHVLNRAHLTSAIIHALFLTLRLLFRRLAWSSLALYLALVSPSLLIEFWLERLGRPRYVPGTKDLVRSGEDMDARGLTEYLWDVVYWTWGCTLLAAVLGDWAWWSWIAIPIYSVWLAYTTFSGMRRGLGMAGDDAPQTPNMPASNRQKKLDKRGGQKVQYR